jgi:hypothetical protein
MILKNSINCPVAESKIIHSTMTILSSHSTVITGTKTVGMQKTGLPSTI